VSQEFFTDLFPLAALWPLGLTQPLTEISTRNIPWDVKAAGALGLITLPPLCADWLELWEFQTPGTLRACLAMYMD